MTDTPMIFAIPSKGRLKEQVEAWLADCGFKLEMAGGSRGYSAELSGLPGVSVRLLSAGDIAAGLDSGELHLGVTGEDLLRERGEDMDGRVMLLRALGFGRADLVVTAPKSWLDVDTMADIDEVGHAHLARTGRRLRVATKYVTQTRVMITYELPLNEIRSTAWPWSCGPSPSSPATASPTTGSSRAAGPPKAPRRPVRPSWWSTSPPPARPWRPTA